MKPSWKSLGARARPAKWSAMTWAVLALVLLCTASTVFVGVELFKVTGHPPPFNSH